MQRPPWMMEAGTQMRSVKSRNKQGDTGRDGGAEKRRKADLLISKSLLSPSIRPLVMQRLCAQTGAVAGSCLTRSSPSRSPQPRKALGRVQRTGAPRKDQQQPKAGEGRARGRV